MTKDSNTVKKTCLVVVVAMVISLAGYADEWFNHYEKAKKAFSVNDWETVCVQIKEALKDKVEPKVGCRTVGIRFVDYLPYYYLGAALYRLNRFEQAQAAFKSSLDFGEIKKVPDLYNNLLQMMEDCRVKLAPPPKDTAVSVETPKEQVTLPVEKPKTQEDTTRKVSDSTVPIVKPDESKKIPVVVSQEKPGLKPVEDITLGAVNRLNEGIRLYFNGELTRCEVFFRDAIQILKHKKHLVTAYQFIAVVLIERHFLEGDTAGSLLEEARRFIKMIYVLEPKFVLDKKYFSPRVIGYF